MCAVAERKTSQGFPLTNLSFYTQHLTVESWERPSRIPLWGKLDKASTQQFVSTTLEHAGASQELPSSPSEAHPGPLDPAPPPESQVQPHQAGVVRGVSEPDDEEEVEEQAAAAHVLICCDTSLRLYPAEGIRIGDRWAASNAFLAPHPPTPLGNAVRALLSI